VDSLMFEAQTQLTAHSAVGYIPSFIDPHVADDLLQEIDDSLRFSRPSIRMYGRTTQLPRSVAWIADNQLSYGYAGISTEPMPWPVFLMPTRFAIETRTGYPFNSVLVNRYEDGNDTVGWHSDDEPELGPAPIIASLSLGATRRFLLRNKHTKETFRFDLAHGDLLLMLGECQTEFTHSVPRTRKVVAPRVNLTFRNLIAPHHVREQTVNSKQQ